MTGSLPCPNPSCGYNLRECVSAALRCLRLLGSPPRQVRLICPQCAEFWVHDHGLSDAGVGPERLVPLEVPHG